MANSMILTHYLSKASWRSKRSSVLSDLFLSQFLLTNFTKLSFLFERLRGVLRGAVFFLFNSLISRSYLFFFKGFVAFQEKQRWRLFSRLSLHALDSRWCKSLRIKYWVIIIIIMLADIIITINMIT